MFDYLKNPTIEKLLCLNLCKKIWYKKKRQNYLIEKLEEALDSYWDRYKILVN